MKKLTKFVGIVLLLSTLAGTTCTPQKEITPYEGPVCKELMDFMNELTDSQDIYDIDRSENRMRPVPELQYENQIATEFKTRLNKAMREDPTTKDTGICPDCFNKKSLPVIHRMHFGNDTSHLGHWDKRGNMYIRANSPEAMAYTALHEKAHATLNYGEDMAELYAQVYMGSDGNIDGRLPIAPRSDWVYGSYQVRGIYNQAKKNGGEKEFWDSMRTLDGYRGMWDKYSPKYEKDGQQVPLMSYREWLDLKMLSGNNSVFKYFNAEDYKEKTKRDLNKDLEKLSLDFEQAYNPKNMAKPAFVKKIRTQVETLSNFSISTELEPVLNVTVPITRVPDIFHGPHEEVGK